MSLAVARAVVSVPALSTRGCEVVASHSHGIPAARVAWAVRLASGFMPRCTCLVMALATQRLLGHHGYQGNVVIGVAKANGLDFEAHAWVECEDSVVMGDNGNHYTRLVSWSPRT